MCRTDIYFGIVYFARRALWTSGRAVPRNTIRRRIEGEAIIIIIKYNCLIINLNGIIKVTITHCDTKL